MYNQNIPGRNEAIISLVLGIVGLVASLFVNSLVGLLVGIPALRLKGDYLAIITLGFGMIIVNIINNLPFAGQNGLAEGSASASLYATGLGFGTAAKVTYIWVALLVTIVCIVLMFMFIRSTTLSTERIKYRVTFSAVTMVIALTLLVLLILQNML